MRGAMEAARLLKLAQMALQDEGRYGAVDVLGPLRLLAETRCPGGPEPMVRDDRDALALADLETAGAAA